MRARTIGEWRVEGRTRRLGDTAGPAVGSAVEPTEKKKGTEGKRKRKREENNVEGRVCVLVRLPLPHTTRHYTAPHT